MTIFCFKNKVVMVSLCGDEAWGYPNEPKSAMTPIDTKG